MLNITCTFNFYSFTLEFMFYTYIIFYVILTKKCYTEKIILLKDVKF